MSVDFTCDEKDRFFVFEHNGTSWQFDTQLSPTTPTQLDEFGTSVDISGNTIVVGAPGYDPPHEPLNAGAALVYGSLDFPGFARADNPIHRHVAPRYIEASGDEIGVPNIVTSVLASYRGYDTMGELAVIFTSGVGVLLLLRRTRTEDREGQA